MAEVEARLTITSSHGAAALNTTHLTLFLADLVNHHFNVIIGQP
jgi:hypothetical protein